MWSDPLDPEYHPNKAQLPDACCPCCSRLRASHPALVEDVLVFPNIFKGTNTTLWRVTGCLHVRPAFGPHPSEQAAQQAVAQVFDRLRQEKDQDRARLLAALHHEKTIQPESDELRLTDPAPRLDAERSPSLRDEPQRVADPAPVGGQADGLERRASEESERAGASDEGGEFVMGAPICEVGSNIYMQHDLNWTTKRCNRCGWEYPKL